MTAPTMTALHVPTENKVSGPHPVLLAISATAFLTSTVALAVILAKIVIVPFVITASVVMPIAGISLILLIVFATLGIVAASKSKSSTAHFAVNSTEVKEIPPVLTYLIDNFGLSLNDEMINKINDFTPIENALKKILASREHFLDPKFDVDKFWNEELSTSDYYATMVIVHLLHLFNPRGNVQLLSDFIEIATVPNETLQKFKADFYAKEEDAEPLAPSPDTSIIKGPMLRKLQNQLINEKSGSLPDNEFSTTCKWRMKDSYVRRHKELFNGIMCPVRRRIMRKGIFQATIHLGENKIDIEAPLNLSLFLPKRGKGEKNNLCEKSANIFFLLTEIFNGDEARINTAKDKLKGYYSDGEMKTIELILRYFVNSLIDQYMHAHATLFQEKIQKLLTDFPELQS